MPAWLLKLLQPLYQLLVAKVIDLVREKVKEIMEDRATKKKIKEIMNEDDPEIRRKRLDDLLNK